MLNTSMNLLLALAKSNLIEFMSCRGNTQCFTGDRYATVFTWKCACMRRGWWLVSVSPKKTLNVGWCSWMISVISINLSKFIIWQHKACVSRNLFPSVELWKQLTLFPLCFVLHVAIMFCEICSLLKFPSWNAIKKMSWSFCRPILSFISFYC